MSVLAMAKRKSRTPEREFLAATLNETTGLARALAVAQQHLERAADLRDQAAERLSKAEAASAESKAASREAIMRSAKTGEAHAANSTAGHLRLAEADAREDLEATEAAVVDLIEAERLARVNAEKAGKKVSLAANDVMVAGLNDIEQMVRNHCIELKQCASIIDTILSFAKDEAGYIRESGRVEYNRQRYMDMVSNLSRLAGMYADGMFIQTPQQDLSWQAAFDALLSNPDAPLPNERP